MPNAPRSPVSLEAAERQFDRIQAFFPRIDSKVSSIFAIASGEMAVASFISLKNLHAWWMLLPGSVFLAAIGWTVYNLYRCTFPNLKRSPDSLIYFKEISDIPCETFVRRYMESTADELKLDFVLQTWQTSTIAAKKFAYLKQATLAAMLSLVPWGCLLIASTFG
ncbi:MAG TPA: Pycsar system effector family protein [Sphingomicrobium sp.]|nr:Pycsar system effector family protein [Sphingomicrobium sp.]